MKLKFCSCRACRAGRHRVSGKVKIKRAVRHGRRLVRDMIRKGNYDIPEKISVTYTD